MYDTLGQIRTDIAQRLAEGAASRRSVLHTPVVATSDGDIRVMVLREFDTGSWTLRFHTDARSPKVAAIRADPTASVLFYDAEAKLQIRARGTARAESEGPVADAAWTASTNFAKRCYLAVDAPGTPHAEGTSGLPVEMEGVQPTDEQILPGRDHFAVVLIAVQEMDWLYLANSGHRRALITADGGHWMTP